MKFKLEYGILLLGVVLLCFIVSPLFQGPGIPLNTDLPAQYVRIMCLSEQGTAPNNWCQYINAGTPTSQYYFPVYDQILALTFKFGQNASFFFYKLTLVLALLIPAIAIWLWVKDKYPVGAACGFTIYLCLTAGWHASGFMETILVGFWPYMLSVGAMLISCYYFNRVLDGEHDNKLNIVWFLISLLFVLHPMTIFAAIVCYLGIIIYNYKNIIKNPYYFIASFVFALTLLAFYWIPFLAKMSFFPSGLGATLDWNLFLGYIWNPVPVWLFIGAAIGIGIILIFKDKEQYPLLAMFIVLSIYTALDFIKSPLNKVQIGVRIGAIIIPVVIMLFSVAIGNIYKSFKKYKIWQIITLVAVGMMIYLMFIPTLEQSKANIILSDDTVFPVFYEALGNLPEGRIFMEDMYQYTGTHVTSLMSILTKREIISFGPIIFPKFNLLGTSAPEAFGKDDINQWTPDEFNKILNRYNIKWALVLSPSYINYFNNTMKFDYQTFGSFYLFDTGINESYFEGDIIKDRSSYVLNPKYVYVNSPGVVKLKVNYYPNWHAYRGNVKLNIYSCDGIICVYATQAGVIDFKYEMLWYEKVGYILSALTAILLIVMAYWIITEHD